MNILLDTNLLINRPDRSLLPPNGQHRLFTGSINYGELMEGIATSASPAERLGRVRHLSAARRIYGTGLPFDDAAAEMYEQVCLHVTASGRLLRRRRVDLMIAATAAAHDMTLGTRNLDDFIGLDDLLNVIRL